MMSLTMLVVSQSSFKSSSNFDQAHDSSYIGLWATNNKRSTKVAWHLRRKGRTLDHGVDASGNFRWKSRPVECGDSCPPSADRARPWHPREGYSVTDDDNLFLHFPQVFSFDKTRELPGLDNRSGLYQAKVQILQQRICMGTCNSCQPIRNEAWMEMVCSFFDGRLYCPRAYSHITLRRYLDRLCARSWLARHPAKIEITRSSGGSSHHTKSFVFLQKS